MKRNYFARVLGLFALAIVIGGASIAANAQEQYRNSVDFDGDDKADPTVIRRYSGTGVARNLDWYTRKSSNGAMQSIQWGANDVADGSYDDASVLGDYDGDGKADYAIARHRANVNGNYIWYIRNSQNGNISYDTFGYVGSNVNYRDRPFAADFDGDGKTDVGVVRYNGLTTTTPPTSYTWYWRSSINGQLGYRTVSINYSNECYPIHGDYDGDRKSDFAQYCAGNATNGKMIFDIVYSSTGVRRQVQWGLSSDYTPIRPGDFDGDGKSDFIAVRPVVVSSPPNTTTYVWYILRSLDGALQTGYLGGYSNPSNGGAYYFDAIFPNDYDGDGKADIAVIRYPSYDSNSQVYWYIRGSLNNQLSVIPWGLSQDGAGPDGF